MTDEMKAGEIKLVQDFLNAHPNVYVVGGPVSVAADFGPNVMVQPRTLLDLARRAMTNEQVAIKKELWELVERVVQIWIACGTRSQSIPPVKDNPLYFHDAELRDSLVFALCELSRSFLAAHPPETPKDPRDQALDFLAEMHDAPTGTVYTPGMQRAREILEAAGRL